jgi:hypothetical protein
MLRKQAASAVVAARRMVVKGAVSIVEEALDELELIAQLERMNAYRIKHTLAGAKLMPIPS